MRVSLELDGREPWTRLLELAGQAERAGWDGVRVADSAGGRDCLALVAAFAVAIPRIRLAAVVHEDLGRHPAAVAKLASTVDQLSHGRLLLGWLPAGDAEGEVRLAEAVTVVEQLTSQERARFNGRYYHLQDAPLDPKPVQLPFPILLVGTTAELAAAAATEWTVTGSQEEIDRQLEALAAACRALGRDRTEISVSAWSDSPPSGVDEWIVPAEAIEEDPEAAQEVLIRIRTSTI